MIRNFEVQDLTQVLSVIERSSSELALEFKEHLLKYKKHSDLEVFVYEKGGLQGLGLVKLDRGKHCGHVELFIEDEEDMYVGAQLDDELTSYVHQHGYLKVVTVVHGANRETYEYYETLGYDYWFGYYEMVYSGGVQQTTPLTFKPYEDAYFEKYVNLMNDGFYELRKENDIRPFACCEANDEMKEIFSSMRNQIFLCVDDSDEIISTFNESEGHLDDIIVNRAYTNKGIGRQTTQAAINQAISNGAHRIHLDVVIWNQKARHIYEKLGFNITETVVFFRKFL